MTYSSRLFTVMLLLDIIQFILSSWAVDDVGCRTPNRGVGTCIPIKECGPIVNILIKLFPVPQYIAYDLQSYECGFSDGSIKVCCPYDPKALDYLIPSSKESKTNTLVHRNINLLPEECGVLQPTSKIVHGSSTDLFEFPWMALISYKKGDEIDFKCSGSILNQWYILTAAHCVTNLGEMELIGVRIGEYNISSPIDCVEYSPNDVLCAERVQDIAIDTVISHPNFNPSNQANDIGLIRLASPINITVESARPICLPTKIEHINQNFSGDLFTVTGWGYTENATKSDILLKVLVPVVDMEDCQKLYQSTPIAITENHICAGGIRGDSCGGDSGGPLQYITEHFNDIRYIQHGVVSFGAKFCGLTNIPGVYTRVDRYMDWILDNLHP